VRVSVHPEAQRKEKILSSTEYLVARRSAIIGLAGGRRVQLVKGAIVRADSLVVRGRADMFKPLSSSDLMARTSFRVGSELVVKGQTFSVDDPIVQGRENFFVPVSERAVDPVPPERATPAPTPAKRAARRTGGPKPTVRRVSDVRPKA
jgi:hypothetical protein